MNVRRWVLFVGAIAVIAGQAGVSGADVPPEVAISPSSPVLVNSPMVIRNMPGGECGASRPPQSSAFATFTTPQGAEMLLFAITQADGNWSIGFTPDQIGVYQLSVACLTSVPPHAKAVVLPPEVIDFLYQDTSFEVVESIPTTEITIDSTTSTEAPSARPTITATAPTFTG